MKKRIFALLFISVIFLSLISGVFAVENAPVDCSQPSRGISGELFDSSANANGLINFIAKKLCIWESGNLSGFEGTTIKYFFLLLVILLIYSSLSYVNFPDTFSSSGGSSFVRFLISFIVGIIATFAITSSELLTILQSYTALGITLTLFFPIMILMFFSLVTAKKASPIGIFGQKILWLIYSVYLFIKSALLFYVNWGISKGTLKPDDKGILQFVVTQSTSSGVTATVNTHPILQFFLGNAPLVSANDNTINILLLIMAIAVFVIFVLGNKYVEAWIAKEARDSELEAQKSMLERSHSYDKLRSEEMKRT